MKCFKLNYMCKKYKTFATVLKCDTNTVIFIYSQLLVCEVPIEQIKTSSELMFIPNSINFILYFN